MDLASALQGQAGIGRAPSEEHQENLEKFLRVWRILVERYPAHGPSPSFFSFVSEHEAGKLLDLGKQVTMRKGQRLYSRGDHATTFGFVLQGTIIATEMRDLRLRPTTTGTTRPNTRAGTAQHETIELTEGDPFGEIPLALDGQVIDGLREGTMHATKDPNMETIVFTIEYKKFTSFLQDQPSSRGAGSWQNARRGNSLIASRLLSKVLPISVAQAPWSLNKKTATGDNVSVAASEQISPGKKTKILDEPPVTMLNMDVLMESAFIAKRAEDIVSDTTRALVGKETRMPHTVVFRDGELVHWHFGWLSSLKRRSRDNLTHWQLLEDFCKGTEAGQTVAVMTCCKRGNTMGKEHAQCRLLDRRRLETIVSGAKNNRLSACIQKYHRMESFASSTEYVLQCCWANNSFTVDWVPESMVECITMVHRPVRMDPGGLKKLHEKMHVRYHQYVPGALSALGDHFNSQTVKINPLEQLDGRSKARARQLNDGTDTRAGNIVEREIRDTVKTACQQIAATLDKYVNQSQTARKKAEADAADFDLHHSASFTLIRSMMCFFKVGKDGYPLLLFCTAAVAHPETKPPVPEIARSELVDPSEEAFLYFAGYGSGHSRLSGMGERALLLDFSEFLQLLTKKELLYTHVSVTDASTCFKHACNSLNAEEGQLKFSEYCECMRALRQRMGWDGNGRVKRQVRSVCFLNFKQR